MQTPSDLLYSKEHEWVLRTGPTAKIGITDFAQDALGDVVWVQLPPVDSEIVAGESIGEIESVKSVSEIFSPVTGKVFAVNTELESTPELINQDPYDAGWIAEVEVTEEPTDLMSADEYSEFVSNQ